MFVDRGRSARSIVWYLRKSLPESPRWLESKGRAPEAEALVCDDREGMRRRPAACRRAGRFGARSSPRRDLFGPALLPRMILGSIVLIVINTLIFGFVTWLPTFFVQQGMTLTKSFTYTLIIVPRRADRLRASAPRSPIAWGAGRPSSARSLVDHRVRRDLSDTERARSCSWRSASACCCRSTCWWRCSTASTRRSCFRPKCGCVPTASATCSGAARPSSRRSSSSALFKAYGVAGVTGLMIGLLLVQIVAVLALGHRAGQARAGGA